MNTQNVQTQPKVRKETKNKIKVDFERTPLKERLKAKFLNLFFLKKVTWWVVRYVLLLGVAYIVLFPFFSKIAASFMEKTDFVDATVRLIPKHFTLDIYKEIWIEQKYLEAFKNTFILSFSTALIQTFVCSFIAYGFAKFKFKGNKLLFGLVILTMIIPHRTLSSAIQALFSKFDILGIFGFLNGGGLDLFNTNAAELTFGETALKGVDIIPESKELPEAFKELFNSQGLNLLNTYWPFIILSLTGLAFKNGLYIFLLRQFFMGVPDELEESAYIDGSGVFRTFFTIILPISIPMMITVFLFSFSWCWTDTFYTGATMFFNVSRKAPYLLTSKIGGNDIPITLKDDTFAGASLYHGAIRNTGGLMIIAPLVIMYVFCQKFLVQGIERSGLTAD
ncbi:MAG: carbohydrate ABC transporter permease [Ruminococcaceae bacterium]|nr:carbohydrate ABC transporter permease [Oscillospiraceae bacterium]